MGLMAPLVQMTYTFTIKNTFSFSYTLCTIAFHCGSSWVLGRALSWVIMVGLGWQQMLDEGYRVKHPGQMLKMINMCWPPELELLEAPVPQCKICNWGSCSFKLHLLWQAHIVSDSAGDLLCGMHPSGTNTTPIVTNLLTMLYTKH